MGAGWRDPRHSCAGLDPVHVLPNLARDASDQPRCPERLSADVLGRSGGAFLGHQMLPILLRILSHQRGSTQKFKNRPLTRAPQAVLQIVARDVDLCRPVNWCERFPFNWFERRDFVVSENEMIVFSTPRKAEIGNAVVQMRKFEVEDTCHPTIDVP